jgi:enoyl-[acyl-carrier-protein] reductase (NADH)
LVEVEDIAQMAVFLASDDSRRVTGTIQVIDSGASAT